MMLPTSALYFSAVQFLMLYILENLNFLTKLQSTEIGLCKLFVVHELATVHECTCDDYLVYLVKLVKLFCFILH